MSWVTTPDVVWAIAPGIKTPVLQKRSHIFIRVLAVRTDMILRKTEYALRLQEDSVDCARHILLTSLGRL